MSDDNSSSDDNDRALDIQSTFTTLPPELVLIVAEYLSTRQILRLARASRQNCELLTSHAYTQYVRDSSHPGKPLQWAVRNNLLKTAQRTLPLGVDVNEHFRGPLKTCTPLLMAIENNNVDMVALLLQYGAHPAAMSASNTPLTYAVLCQNQEIVKLLLSHTAQMPTSEAETQCRHSQHVTDIVNLRDALGNTPLYYAVLKRDASMVELLLSHHADPDKTCPAGCTPLSRAIMNSDLRVTKLLLDPMRARVAHRDNCKDNGLVYAASRVPRLHTGTGDTIEIFKAILLSLKRTSRGRTWFDVSEHTLYTHLDHDIHFMKILLDAGVDPDVKSATGATLL